MRWVSLVAAIGLLAGVVCQGAAAQGVGQEWTMFRGNAAHTASEGDAGPLAEKPTMLWESKPGRQEGPDAISEPAVWTDGVILSSGFIVYSLDKKTGALQWKFDAGGAPSSASVYGNVTYFGSARVSTEPGSLHAVESSTGNLLWRASTGNIGTTPAVADGLVVITQSSGVRAFDAATGEARWEYGFPEGSTLVTSPISIDDRVYAGRSFEENNGGIGSEVFALDLNSGQFQWKSDGFGDTPLSTPGVRDGMLFVGARDGLHALDAQTGESRWRSDSDGPSFRYSPAVANGVVMYGNTGFDGVLALDALTGHQMWSSSDEYENLQFLPTIWGDVAFLAWSASDRLVAVEVETGAVKWGFNVERLGGSPVVSNGILFAPRHPSGLYAIQVGETAGGDGTRGASSPINERAESLDKEEFARPVVVQDAWTVRADLVNAYADMLDPGYWGSRTLVDFKDRYETTFDCDTALSLLEAVAGTHNCDITTTVEHLWNTAFTVRQALDTQAVSDAQTSCWVQVGEVLPALLRSLSNDFYARKTAPPGEKLSAAQAALECYLQALGEATPQPEIPLCFTLSALQFVHHEVGSAAPTSPYSSDCSTPKPESRGNGLPLPSGMAALLVVLFSAVVNRSRRR